MKKFIFILCLTASFVAYAEPQDEGYYMGTVAVQNYDLLWAGAQGFADKGIIIINDDAARGLWQAMVQVPIMPAVPDLESRVPADISLGNCATKIGKSMICKMVPLFNQDATALFRDEYGRVVYRFQCFMDFQSMRAGLIKNN